MGWWWWRRKAINHQWLCESRPQKCVTQVISLFGCPLGSSIKRTSSWKESNCPSLYLILFPKRSFRESLGLHFPWHEQATAWLWSCKRCVWQRPPWQAPTALTVSSMGSALKLEKPLGTEKEGEDNLIGPARHWSWKATIALPSLRYGLQLNLDITESICRAMQNAFNQCNHPFFSLQETPLYVHKNTRPKSLLAGTFAV